MILIRRVKPDEGLPKDIKWLTYDTIAKSGDATKSLAMAIRCYLWRLGVPARIVFRKFKSKKNENQGKIIR